MKRLLAFSPGIGWLIICTILLTLPGTSFPKEDWLDKIWFDKWVHIGLFGGMVLLWCWGVNKVMGKERIPVLFFRIMLLTIVYGIGMEFVQKYLVVNRSFDIGDIFADAAGAITRYFFRKRYIKK